MKTTIEISDALFEAAKALAARRGTTLRALVEDGLRTVIDAAPGPGVFHLRDESVLGRGVQGGLRGRRWADIADRIHEGPGA
jgi:hypothetical protein